MSRELILKMSISVDGFVAGPNGEIDWIFRSSDESSRAWMIELLGNASLHIMGHRTYNDMVSFWPTSTLPMATPMNDIPKAVFSRSGAITPPNVDLANIDPAVRDSWLNPTVGGADLVADIQRLKEEEGKPILVHGGSQFVSSLVAANLIDKYILVVHPVALGSGLPIFAGLEKPFHLELEDLKKFDTGTVVKTYRPA